MLYTILQIIAFQALFLLVYDLFLKRETFFNYNRLYLIFTSILSLILPFVKFPELQKVTTKDMVIELPEVFIGTVTPSDYEILVAEQAGIVLEQPQTPLWQVILYVGIVVAALFFVFKVLKLYWLKEVNPKRWKGNVLIVELLKSSAAFSFFNTIFLGEHISESEKTTIYKHELVHVKQWHTLDLLVFEILRIIFWFNPLVYIYQNRIKELHEYIADEKAVKQNGRTEYYQSLLNQIFDVNNISFTNTFFKKSLIKKRIKMLQKSKSKQINLIKYTVLIPVILAMLVYTSTEVSAQITQDNEVETNQELNEKQIIKKHYDTMMQMKKEDKPVVEIYEYSNMKLNRSKYISSKDDYCRLRAFMQFLADGMLERKSEEGTLTKQDIETAENMKLQPHKNYEEYRAWKKTKEAKAIWEGHADYNEQRLVVDDLGNMTKDEKQRLDALLAQQESNSSIKKLIVCDTKGGSRLELSEPKSIKSSSTTIIEAVDQDVEVPFGVIEEVPTTIECKDLPTNDERKRCISDAIQKHVAKNFNKSIADSLDLRAGKQRIFVAFKIDKQGKVNQVRARASHPALEDEALRVIKTLPQFVPGRQKGKLVVVPYSLPIVFQTSKTPKFDQFNEALTTNREERLKELLEMRERLLKNSSEENPVVINLKKQIDSLRSISVKSLKEHEEQKIHEVNQDEQSKIPYSVVEVSPTHPNCKTLDTNEERKSCTSAEVLKMVNKNFDKDLASTLDLPEGQQKIFGAFTLDKHGFVKDAKARAPHDKLSEEFIRVINLLPQFIPGESKGEKVDVAFSLPIVFMVAKDKKGKN